MPVVESSGPHGAAQLLRDIMGGGSARDLLHHWFLGGTPNITAGMVGPVIQLPNGLKEQTFLGPPMRLENGEIANKYMPTVWPEGKISVRAFTADLVKSLPNGSHPPLEPCCGGGFSASRTEAFLHHWTVNKWQLPGFMYKKIVEEGGINYGLQGEGWDAVFGDAGLNSGANGPCWDSTLHTYFGVGNEVRGTPDKNGGTEEQAYEFPAPYGVVFDSDYMRNAGEFMLLNNHIIDLRNVSDVRGCSECECNVTGVTPSDPRYLGGIECCHSSDFDGGRCGLKPGAQKSNVTYYIRYTIKYRDYDDSVLPLNVMTLEITDNNTDWSDLRGTPGAYPQSHAALANDTAFNELIVNGKAGIFGGYSTCHVEYYVPPCGTRESCVHKVHNSWEIPFAMDLVFIRNHFHNGGLNMSTFHKGKTLCTGLPQYDKNGFLADISTCKLGTSKLPEPVHVEEGDRITISAVYQQDQRPHFGVMGFSVLYAHRLDQMKGRRSSGFWV